jgi:hypothetical protein
MAGYVGKKDPNRAEARKLLKGDVKDMIMPKPRESASSRGRENLRPFKKGGHAHCMPKTQTNMVLPKREASSKYKIEKFSEAEKMKKSHGGSVYEQEMTGERPSKKTPHINYETQMRGEHGKKAKMASGGCFKKGTHVKRAMGGPGKMRKDEMTSSGMPVFKKGGRKS